MKNKSLIVLIVAAVAFATACNNTEGSNTVSTKLVLADKTAKTKYQCPMKCEGDTAYTTEGQCPVCEMDLEKVTK